MSDQNENVSGNRLLKAVEAISISPADAKQIVDQYRRKARKRKRSDQEVQEIVAKKIVRRYSKLAAISGGATALAGVVPGIGTALAVTGGAIADASICMKFQVDMCICMAEAFDYDLNSEDARHLSFLIAAGGAIEKAGVDAGVRLGTAAGVRLLRQHLKGAALQAVKELFKKLGVVFTRKALEKAIPFGIGVVLGSSANYALTRYVGKQATEWFTIDRDLPADAD